ncbi:hypothetical protein [Kitasatospora sp. CB02891]|uniref:hypothetical protein n=1 Tax=Kitasatospora sp. CB02891 TaxID=2020329 RepID=UPI0012FDD911|nr:hypothetical protein [Kitasatospora sp. CB02891]
MLTVVKMPLNRAEISALCDAAGLILLDIAGVTDVIPADAAWMASACGSDDGRFDEEFEFQDPDLVRNANEAWFAIAQRHRLLDQRREFLLSLAVLESDRFPVSRWALVKLKDEWDIIGAGTANGLLGGPYGRPGFVMVSKTGYTVVAGTTWQDGISIISLPNPHRASAIRKFMTRTPEGSVTDEEYENIQNWLSRPPNDTGRAFEK